MKKIPILIFLIFFLIGCSTVNHRTNVRFRDYFKESKKIAIMPLDVKIFLLTAGDVNQYKDDWTREVKGLLLKTLQENLEGQKMIEPVIFDVSRLSISEKDTLDAQNGIFRAVSQGVIDHTYNSQTLIKDRKNNFDYTLGAEFSVVEKWSGAPTAFYISGRNYIWTFGRSAMYIFAMAVFGESVVYVVPPGNEYFMMALVDTPTGDIIWFNYIPMPGDLRDEKVMGKIVKKMLDDFSKGLEEKKGD